MIVSATLPPEFAKRLRDVMEARKTHRKYSHLRAQAGDVVRELLGEWVLEQEQELGLDE